MFTKSKSENVLLEISNSTQLGSFAIVKLKLKNYFVHFTFYIVYFFTKKELHMEDQHIKVA